MPTATKGKRYAPQHKDGFAYRSIDQIQAHNHAIGHHWFSPKTMAFFNCRVMKDLHLGAFFISSESDTYSTTEPVRLYTLRVAKGCGCIDTVGNFQAFATLSDARRHLYALTPADLERERECHEHGTTANDYNTAAPALDVPASPSVVLMTGAELARRYGVSQPTILNWETRHAGFPAPARTVSLRRLTRALWDVSQVDEWVCEYRERVIATLPTVPD